MSKFKKYKTHVEADAATAPAANSSVVVSAQDTLLLLARDGTPEAVLQVAPLLDQEDIDVNARYGRKSSTLLLEAASRGHSNMVECLLERKAALTLLDKSGEHALHVAARNGHLAICKLLVESNGGQESKFLDAQSKGKLDTPLILAASWGHEDCMQYLKEQGADTTLVTRNGTDAAGWLRRARRKKRLAEAAITQ
jgi:ankyrin repeat protein